MAALKKDFTTLSFHCLVYLEDIIARLYHQAKLHPLFVLLDIHIPIVSLATLIHALHALVKEPALINALMGKHSTMEPALADDLFYIKISRPWWR